MEWILLDGFRLQFYNPIKNPSFQSLTGQAPNFHPQAPWYGLFMANVANNDYPDVYRPLVTPGTSSSIKVYYLDYWSYTGVLILNKDTSTSASGVVNVVMKDKTGLNCLVLSASSLSATSGFTFAGMNWGAGNYMPQGTYNELRINADGSGVYVVPVNYSQMVFCRTLP